MMRTCGFRQVQLALMAVAIAAALTGQTTVDLRTQTKNADFSLASTTKPAKTGISLPATCTVGEQFFKSDAPPGANLFGCTAANIWTVMSGGMANDSTLAHGPGSSTTNCLPMFENTDGTTLAQAGSGSCDLTYNPSTRALENASGQPSLITMTDQVADPSAPGTSQTELYSKSGAAYVRAGTTGAARKLLDTTDNILVANFNGGTGASSSTFWRGDGTWAVPSGGGSMTCDPYTGDQVCLHDEFPNANTTSGQIGELGWGLSGTGSYSRLSSAEGKSGLVRLTGNASNKYGMFLGAWSTAQGMLSPPSRDNWHWSAWVRVERTTAGAYYYITTDRSSGAGTVPDRGCGFRWIQGTDANWTLYCQNGSGTATASTAVAPTALTWTKLEVYANAAGTIYGKVNGGTPVNLTNNIDASGQAMFFVAGDSSGTATAYLDVDWWAFYAAR